MERRAQDKENLKDEQVVDTVSLCTWQVIEN